MRRTTYLLAASLALVLGAPTPQGSTGGSSIPNTAPCSPIGLAAGCVPWSAGGGSSIPPSTGSGYPGFGLGNCDGYPPTYKDCVKNYEK